MKPEKQRIAIAEECPGLFLIDGGGMFRHPEKLTGFDPLNDLNAMHEAEELLKLEDPHAYACYAINLCEKYGCDAVSLKPHIRAEEFLRTGRKVGGMSYNLNNGGEHRDECEEGRDQELLEDSQYDADAGKRADEYRRALTETRDDLILISKSAWDSVRKIDDLITKLES